MEHQKASMKDWEAKLAEMSKKAHTRPVFVLFTGASPVQTLVLRRLLKPHAWDSRFRYNYSWGFFLFKV
jgi:hypothetical protein